MVHPKFAQSPEHYVRAFLLILKDLHDIFEYVEPSDANLTCYSYRIHALLLRTCIEIEANCKAILKENGYTKSGDMNMVDYKKINTTHRLSSYRVKVPNWTGAKFLREPFLPWASGGTLPWYQAYNTTKHDRQGEFMRATFEQLIDAVGALLIILSAQFETNDFSPAPSSLTVFGPNDGMECGIGGYFRVKFPDDWPVSDRYDFDWSKIAAIPDPFQTFDYSKI